MRGARELDEWAKTAKDQFWRVEEVQKGRKLAFFPPSGPPIFISPNMKETHAVKNARASLRRAGLALPGDAAKLNTATVLLATSPPAKVRELIPAVVKDQDAFVVRQVRRALTESSDLRAATLAMIDDIDGTRADLTDTEIHLSGTPEFTPEPKEPEPMPPAKPAAVVETAQLSLPESDRARQINLMKLGKLVGALETYGEPARNAFSAVLELADRCGLSISDLREVCGYETTNGKKK